MGCGCSGSTQKAAPAGAGVRRGQQQRAATTNGPQRAPGYTWNGPVRREGNGPPPKKS